MNENMYRGLRRDIQHTRTRKLTGFRCQVIQHWLGILFLTRFSYFSVNRVEEVKCLR